MNDRLFPARPILAVSAAVFRKGRVLVVRRARAPLLGHFSLRGGSVEIGETMAALGRELMEEVGVEAEIIAFNRLSRRSSLRGPGARISSSPRSWPAGRAGNRT
jgi:ADP-ribose pyrophosphatase YjhB (NUDIX family)